MSDNSQSKEPKRKTLTFTGHSLGGGLAQIAAIHFGELWKRNKIHCVTFGSPRVGNKVFGTYYRKIVNYSKRYVYGTDLIPLMPLSFRFTHVCKKVMLGDSSIFSNWWRRLWYRIYHSVREDHNIDKYISALE